MTAWVVDWMGEATGAGGFVQRIPIEDITKPVQTAMIEYLEAELPDVEIWADINRSQTHADSIVVESRAGEWIKSSSVFQRRTRDLDIFAFSATSDGAERRRDQIAHLVRSAPNFILTDISELQGGWNPETEQFVRGISITARTSL